ncbi:hypothetical protein HYT23_02565 [Candidatus Pacearchaeota archaeon]|nr:hypothetical protein [Candidatus Pacearchaeota archaeon]
MNYQIVFLFLFLIPLASSATCNPDWQCSLWSPCINNTQIRNCIDFNACADETSKPLEEQFCGAICNANWTCSEWTPERCPENQTQIRGCADSNNCGKIDGKPEEIQTCEFQRDFSWIFYFIVAVTIIFIVGAVWIIIKRFKKSY